MFQNIKVDIIYYKTNTDFEMEFNLCGCCRMRLLTDKSPDSKTLIHSLARAVSRSRVIILTGSLFGDDGIIKISADAIGSKVKAVNLSNYGVSGEEDIEIIEGSTPLVTPEGYFGGCIIEKGPQTLILLSDSKSVRKTIMQTLIHPYIEELCAMELQEKAAMTNAPVITEENEEIEEDVIFEEESDIIIDSEETEESYEEENFGEEFSPITDSEDEQLEEYDEEDITLSQGMVLESEEEEVTDYEEDDADFFIESRKMRANEAERYNAAYGDYDYDDNGLLPDEFKKSGSFNHTSLNLPIMILSIILLLTIAVLCYCFLYVPAKNGVDAMTYIEEIKNIFSV